MIMKTRKLVADVDNDDDEIVVAVVGSEVADSVAVGSSEQGYPIPKLVHSRMEFLDL